MYTFIANPNARSGRGILLWKQIEKILLEKEIAYNVLFTKYQHHATRLVHDLTSDGAPHTIVVLGGDGTLNEVIDGIRYLDKVTLGYIPLGSGNDFARGLGLPTDIHSALEQILSPSHYTAMNVGVLDYENKHRRFAVSTGIGFDAAVCHQVMVTPLKAFLNRLKLGKLTYLGVALHKLLTLKPVTMTVTTETGETKTYHKVYFTAVMNLKYEGGGFNFCPAASGTDDRLDIITVSELTRLKVLCLLPTAFKGWHTRFRGITLDTCTEVTITSDCALPVHTDGEPVFLQSDIHVHLSTDGKLVVFHDDDLSRICGRPEAVEVLPSKELQRCRLQDTTETIPLFSEVLSLVDGQVPLLIELKIPKSSLSICEKTWEALKNYNGPYMVQSFNTLGIWWFRRHAPHVLRGQLSSNLTADNLPEPWILSFIVKHLLGNVLGRPDFISYKLADLPRFEVWFLKHILHLPIAVWTLRTPDTLKKGTLSYDMQIFEKKKMYY